MTHDPHGLPPWLHTILFDIKGGVESVRATVAANREANLQAHAFTHQRMDDMRRELGRRVTMLEKGKPSGRHAALLKIAGAAALWGASLFGYIAPEAAKAAIFKLLGQLVTG